MSRVILAACALAFAVVLSVPTASADDRKPSATVRIKQTQVAFLLSGTLGGGTLYYKGKSYSFSIGGLGVGGIGVSSLEATGKVYEMKSLSDFAGLYGQARTGWAAGEKGEGKMWLQNEAGVVIELKAKRDGVMLAMGADGVLIQMD